MTFGLLPPLGRPTNHLSNSVYAKLLQQPFEWISNAHISAKETPYLSV